MARRSFVALVAFLALGLLVFANHADAKEVKVGFVDLAKVFDQYSKTVEFEKSLEEKGKSKEAERNKLVEEVRKMQDEAAVLSEDAKAKKQPAIDEKIKALREFNRVTQDELIKERNEKVSEILADIQKVVEAYSKQETFDVMLNSRMLLYGNEQLDVTEEILKRLNTKQ